MKRKILSMVLALVLVLTTLTACGSNADKSSEGTNSETDGSGTDTSDSGKQITLRISWWGNQTRNDKTVEAIELYESLNSNINIEYEFSDWGSYWDKLSTQAAGGTLPDIIQHDYSYLSQYVSSNQLANLTPYIESGILDVSNVAESILAGGTINDNLYALCLGTNARTMLYDKEVVDQAGVTIPLQPTIEELYNLGQEIFDKTGAKTYFDGGSGMLTMLARAKGAYIYDEILNGNSEYATEFFDYVEKFSNAEFAITPEILAEKNPDVVETKPILDQTTWNDFAFSNMFISVNNAAGRDLEMVMYPKAEDNTQESMYLNPSMFFTVSETSSQKEEAAKFLNWLTNDIDCNKILMGERGIPISSEVAQAIKAEVDETTVKVFDYIAEVEKVATTINPPNPAGSDEVESYVKLLVESIRYDEMDSSTAAQGLMEQAKSILEKATK